MGFAHLDLYFFPCFGDGFVVDVWHGTDDFGASLKSFQKMLGNKGYDLVGCNITGANAFFVKKELINEKFLNNFSSEFHYEPLRIWLIKKYENELKVSI